MTKKASRSGRPSRTNGASASSPRGARPKRRRGRPTRQEAKRRDEEYAQFAGERLIHRYGNRRFYDLKERRAITQQQITELVQKGERLRILDVDTNEDITRRVLTEIIVSQENQQTLQRLPLEFLRRLIATQGAAVDKWLDTYLRIGADMLQKGVAPQVPFANSVEEISEFLNEMFTGKSFPKAPPAPKHDDAASKREREIADLRRRLDELSRAK